MTDAGTTTHRGGSLTTRLAVAFAAVALIAVALVVGLMVVGASRETATLASSERQRAADSAARAAGTAYARARGWATADLTGAQQIAAEAGGRLVVVDAQGTVVSRGGAGPGSGPRAGGNASVATVRVAGRDVGRVTLRVPGSGLSPAERRLRDRLVTIAVLGGAFALVIAMLAALILSRRLTSPLRRLTAAARRLEAGDLDARADAAEAPGEIGELAGAFDHLASTLADQARVRRALLADIAHELRTPLAILRGTCEAMVDGVEPPTPDRLSSLHDEVLRLEGLVADLETLADSEAASLTLAHAPVDVADVVRDALALLGARAAATGIDVRTDLEPGVVLGDRARLVQIVENLLSNALKFTPAGGRVSVGVASVGDHVELVVADTGRGIDPDELPHVFERYWRGRASADTSGRGIGLAVVDELVRAHGGTVTAAAAESRGSRFTVRIPAAR